MPPVRKAYSYDDIQRRQFKTLPFQGIWKEHIGEPEVSGSWSVHGGSGHGKTSYEMQLVKQFCQFERVHINTLEEGMRLSFQQALKRYGMAAVKSMFTFQSETYDQLVARLSRKRQAKVVVIDSTQYFFRHMRLSHYFELLDAFPTTLFIFLGHARGNRPKGMIAEDILYHSDVKIHVKDFVANVLTSRFGGSKPFIIYEEGYRERHLQMT